MLYASKLGIVPQRLVLFAFDDEFAGLIDAGEYDAAIAKLRNWKGRTEWASYARFNIGVALVRSGRVDEAVALLDELGSMNPFTYELAALRDKANVALGYALLQDGQPYAAKAPLQRVRLKGPFSNKALLGVGWADAEMDQYGRALVPWMELRGRDLLDSAVQESMLAIPYALAQLDSISQAADHYLNAVEAFYEESSRIDSTISHIESGRFFDEFLSEEDLDLRNLSEEELLAHWERVATSRSATWPVSSTMTNRCPASVWATMRLGRIDQAAIRIGSAMVALFA